MTPSSAARAMRDALEPIATLDFHSGPSLDAYARLGLDDFDTAYFWLRSSVLGEADPAVVVAAFGVWEPTYVRTNLATGRRAASLARIRATTDAGATAAARAALAGVDETQIRHVTAILRRGIAAADVTARPLFAGNRALDPLTDVRGELWRVATAWRELRGDTHLAASAVHGVTGLQANIINELDAGYDLGEYTATRHWSREQVADAVAQLQGRGIIHGAVLTTTGAELRERIERATDVGVAAAVDAVGDDIGMVVDATNAWAQRIIDCGWFPDDARKRAAG